MVEKLDPRTSFFVNMGKAISTWQTIEQMLGMMFHSLLEPRRTNSSDIVFGLLDFNRKCRAVKELIDFHVPDKVFRDECKKLFKKLDRQAKHRNHLVHWQLLDMHGPGESDPGKGRFILTPSFTDSRNLKIPSGEDDNIFRKIIDEKEVTRIVSEFSNTLSQVMRLSGELIKHLHPPESS